MGEQALRVFVRRLRLIAEIGLYPHERGRPQPILVDIEVALESVTVDRFSDTVDYDRLAQEARNLAANGHIDLVETFAQRLATACLSHKGVVAATVRVEKPDALGDAEAAGVEVVLFR